MVLRPISDEGRQWFEDNVGEPEPGGIYTCEPRMAQDILQAVTRAICACRVLTKSIERTRLSAFG